MLKIKTVGGLLLQAAHEVVHAAGLQLLLHHLYLLRRADDLHDHQTCTGAQRSHSWSQHKGKCLRGLLMAPCASYDDR